MLICAKSFVLIMILLFILYVFSLVKKNVLRAEYSVYWVLAGIVLLFFSIFEPLQLLFSGIAEEPSFLLMIVTIILFSLIFIVLGLSISMSRIITSIKELTQHIGIIKFEEDEKKRRDLSDNK